MPLSAHIDTLFLHLHKKKKENSHFRNGCAMAGRYKAKSVASDMVFDTFLEADIKNRRVAVKHGDWTDDIRQQTVI